jgi:hypothetical protein
MWLNILIHFWHQYQCVLHISTRNKILCSHRIDFRRILPALNLREVSHLFLLFIWEHHLLAVSPNTSYIECFPFFWSFAPSSLSRQTYCGHIDGELKFVFVWVLICWVNQQSTLDEALMEVRADAPVVSVLSPTYSSHGPVKDRSTMQSTVNQYCYWSTDLLICPLSALWQCCIMRYNGTAVLCLYCLLRTVRMALSRRTTVPCSLP